MKSACKTIVLFFIAAFIFGCAAPVRELPKDFKFRFVFISDTRGDYKANPPAYIAEKIIPKFIDQLLGLQPRPALVFFNGDMIAKTAYRESPESAARWKDLFLAPLIKNDIPTYVVPGNHIVEGNKNETPKTVKYIKVFNDLFATSMAPRNGPQGFESVSYSVVWQNCHFITATPFTTHDGYDNTELDEKDFVHSKQGYEYYMNESNRVWLADQLKKSECAFKIVFTHVPLYAVGPHHNDQKSIHSHLKNRDEIAQLLVKNRVDLYVASHEHLYARALISASNPEKSGLSGNLLQVIVGSAGAVLAHGNKRNDMIFEKYTVSYDYLVGDVYTERIECTAYDENGKSIDKFIIEKRK